jgi:CHAD domain-containing protein
MHMAKVLLFPQESPAIPESSLLESVIPEASPPSGPTLPLNGQNRLAVSLLKRKVNAVYCQFPSALTGDEEAIHQLRVAGRRLRVALPLLVVKPDGRRALRALNLLRCLTQTAGSSRDLDVLVASYDERLRALPSRTAEQKLLRNRLTSARRRSRTIMASSLLDLEISRLRNDLTKLVLRGGPPPSVICERFAAMCSHESRCLHEGFTKLGARLDVTSLHSLRRRARRLRYAVEVFDQIRSYQSSATKPWKMIQDLIGVLHDHHVLAKWFDDQAKNDLKCGKNALAVAANEEAAWARATMRRLHKELLAANPIAIVAQGLSELGQASPVSYE